MPLLSQKDYCECDRNCHTTFDLPSKESRFQPAFHIQHEYGMETPTMIYSGWGICFETLSGLKLSCHEVQ